MISRLSIGNWSVASLFISTSSTYPPQGRICTRSHSINSESAASHGFLFLLVLHYGVCHCSIQVPTVQRRRRHPLKITESSHT
ncbi:hypothetical protein BDV95DRAFT_585834 [Massariosphaeria phaeospora]|uniref:Uncharacterized protein n=1 Tax=Massariosphaeria phaeospora TaxID=100035 RepID=A0A7C8I376_9PLEO|nr:hypothetical protein BDV95DRAFT_585834 [Massariosphaeria phaeospora]